MNIETNFVKNHPLSGVIKWVRNWLGFPATQAYEYRRPKPRWYVNDTAVSAVMMVDRAKDLINGGSFDEVEPLLRQALQIYNEQLAPDHPYFWYLIEVWGWSYMKQGRYDEAISLCENFFFRKTEALRSQNCPWPEDLLEKIRDSIDEFKQIKNSENREAFLILPVL